MRVSGPPSWIGPFERDRLQSWHVRCFGWSGRPSLQRIRPSSAALLVSGLPHLPVKLIACWVLSVLWRLWCRLVLWRLGPSSTRWAACFGSSVLDWAVMALTVLLVVSVGAFGMSVALPPQRVVRHVRGVQSRCRLFKPPRPAPSLDRVFRVFWADFFWAGFWEGCIRHFGAFLPLYLAVLQFLEGGIRIGCLGSSGLGINAVFVLAVLGNSAVVFGGLSSAVVLYWVYCGGPRGPTVFSILVLGLRAPQGGIRGS